MRREKLLRLSPPVDFEQWDVVAGKTAFSGGAGQLFVAGTPHCHERQQSYSAALPFLPRQSQCHARPALKLSERDKPFSLFLLLLIVMPLDGEEHASAQHEKLERKEDYREPIPHFDYFQATTRHYLS
ncbi:hypothetical protein HGP16_25950 [Rhizobium sp. P40RR-XXII]|uniref:hypothetical protein n=1 Tax=Rhizobium sp. P40RR-XXII TaxID=2726739 RepID=UPI00145687D7|nr:hypothetical protein [Rhizobium sp. P40RR-XXII]NLS19985.1 hypothetical protein [Rhizobium sp. P40RR-XXII]